MLKKPPSKTEQSHLKELSIHTVRNSNKDYQNMMEPIYQHQAARLIQYHWRKKPDSKAPPRLNLIQEPWGLKDSEHAERINSDQWLFLDFKEPEMPRNLYKALRKNKLSTDNMVTAYLLYHTLKFNAAQSIKEHPYDNTGPFKEKDISYASEESLQIFYQNLKKLPKNEQKYFSIALSKTAELIFLLTVFVNDEVITPKFDYFVELYIKKTVLPLQEKEKLLGWVKNFSSKDTELQQEAVDGVEAFLLKQDPELVIKKNTRNEFYSTTKFLAALFGVNEQLPLVELSPDYDENDPDSPLLCQIIPTVSSFKILQEAMHGEKETCDPFYVVGEFTPSLIRVLEEQPELFGLKRQARPVELTHPDIKKHEAPHGYESDDGLLTLHDHFHCWRDGASRATPLIRYMRTCLEPKGFYMSQSLWRLSDKDFSIGRMDREQEKELGVSLSLFEWHAQLFETHRKSFFTQLDKHDDNLLFLIDMIINTEVWMEFFHEHPAVYIYQNRAVKNLWCLIVFMKTYNLLENIINFYQDIPLKNPLLCYILAYRLRDYPAAPSLLAQLDSLPNGLSALLKWRRNEGLVFKNEDGGDEVWVEDVKDFTLMKHCEKLIEIHQLKPEKNPTLFNLKPFGYFPSTRFFWEQLEELNELISDRLEQNLRLKFKTKEPQCDLTLSNWLNSFFAWDEILLRRNIMGYLLEQYDRYKEFKGKDLILVMGQPGSGKTTLVNALRGLPIKRERKDNKTFFIVDEAKLLPGQIPSKMEEDDRKLFSSYASSLGNNTVYIDFAGSNYYHNYKACFIAQLLSIELFKKFAKSLRILYVASYEKLMDDSEIIEDSQLSDMLNSYQDLPPVLLALTHLGPESMQTIHENVQNAVHCLKLSNNPQQDLHCFVKHSASHSIINYNDTQKSIEQLNERLFHLIEKKVLLSNKPYLPWQEALVKVLRQIRSEQLIDGGQCSFSYFIQRYFEAKQSNEPTQKQQIKQEKPTKVPDSLKKTSNANANLKESRLAFFTKPKARPKPIQDPEVSPNKKKNRLLHLGLFATAAVVTVTLIKTLKPAREHALF